MEDLEATIMQLQATVNATPEHHPARAALLNDLASHLSSRYARTEKLRDLEAAINRTETAVKATPEERLSRAVLLNNLGSRWNMRYERSTDAQDMEAAINYTQAAINHAEAVGKALEDNISRARIYNNLGKYLRHRYERTRNLHDLNATINHMETAGKAIAEDHP